MTLRFGNLISLSREQRSLGSRWLMSKKVCYEPSIGFASKQISNK